MRSKRGERGQGVIEFALILSILMLLFLGTVDFARVMYYDLALGSAARVGAETAINHCVAPGQTCGYTSGVSDAFVMQATECESAGSVKLLPALDNATTPASYPCTPCPTGPCNTTLPVSTCDSTCVAHDCTNDVCIQTCTDGTCSDLSSGSTLSSGTLVKVTVGYDFTPISPILTGMANLPFVGPAVNLFKPTQCWPGDTAKHTLCASSTGRVS